MIEPNAQATIQISLLHDLERDENERPSIEFRVLRRRDTRALAKLTERIDRLATYTDDAIINRLVDECEEFLKVRLIGWNNQTDETGAPMPFDPDDFDRVVTEFMKRLRGENLSTAEERKKSASRWRSSTGQTVASAVPESNAATDRPTERRLKLPAQAVTETDAVNARESAGT